MNNESLFYSVPFYAGKRKKRLYRLSESGKISFPTFFNKLQCVYVWRGPFR